MLRSFTTRSALWLRPAASTRPQIAGLASQSNNGPGRRDRDRRESGFRNRDRDRDDEEEREDDEFPERPVLLRRTMGPPAARRSRFQAVSPENRGILRRRLLDAYEENDIELPKLQPDVEDLKRVKLFHRTQEEWKLDTSGEARPLNLGRLGLLRQIVFTDSVNNVLAQGRTLNFRALVVVGNQRGCAGYAVGKGSTVNLAIERATRKAMDSFTYVDRFDNRTLYHEVKGKWNSATLFLRPTPMGKGVVASDVVACVLNCFGLTDVVSKCHGQRNPYTVVPAVFNAISKHQTAEERALMRGTSLVELSTLARMRNL